MRRKYGLTIDPAEAAAAEAVLSDCDCNGMEVLAWRHGAGPARVSGLPVHAGRRVAAGVEPFS